MRGIQAFFPPARKEEAVSDNPSRLLLERWLDRKKRSFDLILTEDILDEYASGSGPPVPLPSPETRPHI